MCVGIPNEHRRGGFLPDLRKSTFKSRATGKGRRPLFLGGFRGRARTVAVLVGLDHFLERVSRTTNGGKGRDRRLRERVRGAISTVGSDALKDMIAAGQAIEVSCQFCDEKYTFQTAELETILGELEPRI